MITKETITEIIGTKLESDQAYIVDIHVTPDNRISVVIDHFNGIPINYCIEISKLIEANLNREEEDFELEVASAGIGQPFKVYKQYIKNINREVEILLLDGKKLKGVLNAADEHGFTVTCQEMMKVEGKKKKELQNKQYMFNFDGIKQVKDIVSFK